MIFMFFVFVCFCCKNTFNRYNHCYPCFTGSCSHQQQQHCDVLVSAVWDAAHWTCEAKSKGQKYSHVDLGTWVHLCIILNDAVIIIWMVTSVFQLSCKISNIFARCFPFLLRWLQAAFAFSLVWSVGGSCDSDSREKFSEYFRELLSGKSEEHPIPESVGRWDCPMHEAGLVYDYFYEVLC